MTIVDPNGIGLTALYPPYGVYTLPLTPIDVWEDLDTQFPIGDYTWEAPAQLFSAAQHGAVTPASYGFGHWTYRSALNFTGTDTFQILDNPDGPPVTITLNVQNVNDPPVPSPFTVYVAENSTTLITPPVTDIENDPYNVWPWNPPANGMLVAQGNGFAYTPNPDFVGTDPFTYFAGDPDWFGNALGTIIVTNVNDGPAAMNQSVTVFEATPHSFVLEVADVEGDALTVQIVDPPVHGSLTNTGLTFTYTSDPNYFGSDTFTYKANDGQVDSAPATVSITVVSPNDTPLAPEYVKVAWINFDHFLIRWAPVVNATGYNVYRYDTNTSDWLQIATNLQALSVPLYRELSTPGGSVSYAVRALNSNGAGTPASGSLTPDPSALWPSITGSPDFWKIGYTFVEPRFTQSLTAGADGMAEIRVAGETNEYFAVSWKTNLGPGHIFVFTNLTPGVAYEVQFTTVAESGTGTSAGPPNSWFYSPAPSATLQEDTSATINLGTQTAEVLQILTSPSHGALTPLENGRYTTYTPAPNFFGTDTFQILDHASGPPVTVTVNVQNVNDAPEAQPLTIYVAEDSIAVVPSVVFDLENDPWITTVSIGAVHGDSFGYQFTHLMYVPYPDFFGQDEFWYYALDESEGPSARVTVIVTNVNDAPVAANHFVMASEDTAITFTLNASDVDGDPLSVEFASGPSQGVITNTGLTVTYTPNPNYHDTDSFTYRVSDGQATSEWKTVDLLVNPVNDAPTADGKTASTSEDQSVAIALTGSDIDGDHLTFVVVTPPQHGEFTGDTYIPAANYHGSDSFTYKATDGDLDGTVVTVSITITPVNDPPVADSKSVVVNEDGTAAVALTGSDVEGSALAFTVIDAPAHGLFLNGTYTPAANYNGPDSFTYKANDGQVDSAAATVSITINSVNDAPVANNQSVSTAYNTAVNIVLTGSDVEGSALTYTTLTSPANGTLTGTGANRTLTPNIGWSGTTSFTFKVNDGALDNATATVTVTVAGPGSVPAAPSALTATAISRTQINLAWNDNSNNEDGFKIERSPNGSSSWVQIATVGPNVRNYSNTGLAKNTRYYYRVRTHNILGNSAYSNTANARTLN